MILQTWSEVLSQSFQNLWVGVVSFIPNLVVAIIIFIIGWIISALLGRVISQMVRSLGIDKVLRRTGVEKTLNKAGFQLNSGKFIGSLVKWFIIVVFLVASFDVLGLSQVNQFLQQVVLLYLPRVIAAVFILLVAAVIAEATENLVKGSAKMADVKISHFLGVMSRWSIWFFAILMALYQMGVAAAFIQTIFTGLIVALSLAIGLSFGLGGKTAAGEAIEKFKKNIR
jgi:small-conductance mechanosensitive channel